MLLYGIPIMWYCAESGGIDAITLRTPRRSSVGVSA